MKHVKICTVVTGKTVDEFLNNLDHTQRLSKCVELRLDYINNIKPQDIQLIRQRTTQESICTCRSRDEGGQFKGEEKERIQIIETAFNAGFDYVDIELSTLEKHKIHKPKKSKIIVSYHNFTETPKYHKLLPVIIKMKKHKPDIIKIATHIKKDEDVHTLFRLLVDRDGSMEWIVIGMGEMGKITRILSPILGGYITFASTNNSETAPGQIHLEEMKKIYNNLHVTY